MHLVVKALGMVVGMEKYDICKDLGVTCPVEANQEVGGGGGGGGIVGVYAAVLLVDYHYYYYYYHYYY